MSNERERALVRRVCRQYGATGSEPSDVEIDALIGDFDRFDAPPAASGERTYSRSEALAFGERVRGRRVLPRDLAALLDETGAEK